MRFGSKLKSERVDGTKQSKRLIIPFLTAIIDTINAVIIAKRSLGDGIRIPPHDLDNFD